MRRTKYNRGGFALPTVLIASVVMMTVLAVSVTSVAAVRATLKTQYYEQLAKAAGEAGVAYAKACLAKNGNVPLWTDAKPLGPSTDCAGNQMLSPVVQVVAVAGGGGGGGNQGGGGGGGGVLSNDALAVSAQSYSVVVGAGGAAGSTSAAGGAGANSQFGSALAPVGGGGGASRFATNSPRDATAGGSGGGGAGVLVSSGGAPSGGAAGTVGQGNVGGQGSSGSTGGNGGGGGGGSTAGGAASGTTSGTGVSGVGGTGLLNDYSGAMVYYGAGGSGGRWGSGTVGIPGVTGGGIGGNDDGTAGAAGVVNTGGGGGGGGGSNAAGGVGGSGVVVVRYADNGSITATGGTVSTAGPYKTHTFKSGTSSFVVSNAATSSCPSDIRCSVMVNGNIRSSFSVAKPTMSSDGKAVAIANNGYVELIRDSNNTVWRTYRQPSVQPAVVPDFCSGSATSGLGWSNAVKTSVQEAIPTAPSATTISLSDSALSGGRIYFRKDFVVTTAGSYTVSSLTTTGQDNLDMYVDGALIQTADGSLVNNATTLAVGCHTISAVLTNKTIAQRPSEFTASISQDGGAPIVTTDTSWRVSVGASTSFSSPDYYADPSMWSLVSENSLPNAQQLVSSWQTVSGDAFARMVVPNANGCPNSCPASSSSYIRDSKDIYVSVNTDVTVTTLCDDDCTVYIDGTQAIANSPYSNTNQQVLTLTPGYHRVAGRIYNAGSSASPSSMAITVKDNATNTIMTRTDRTWTGANTWVAGAGVEPFGYEASFVPSPWDIAAASTFDVVVVAGGGGGGYSSGGGGGGGGTRYLANQTLATGSTTVTVGGGGAGAANSSTQGSAGANSSFGAISAVGGGGGASRDGGTAPTSGGSGGGGAGPIASGATRDAGAAGTPPQGYDGGAGTPNSTSATLAKGGGGGGAGGSGMLASTTLAGNGGPGFITYTTGARLAFAGGGGGSTNSSNGTAGSATDGGSIGSHATPTAALANTGGGGGSGGSSAANGGSGIVIVRYKKGTITATGGTITEVTLSGITYRIHTFTSSGTFQVTSL